MLYPELVPPKPLQKPVQKTVEKTVYINCKPEKKRKTFFQSFMTVLTYYILFVIIMATFQCSE